MKIKIIHERHFIEGDRYKAFLIDGNGETICLTAGIKMNGYLAMHEAIAGLKFRLEELGNSVEVINTIEEDPNFNTAEEAEDYLNNKGE